jgi:hypothetical protein
MLSLDSVAVVTCDENKTINGVLTLDGKNRACIEVAYFSQSSSLTLTIDNNNEMILTVCGNVSF